MRYGRAVRFLLIALLLWSGWACTETLVSVVDVATVEIDPPSPAIIPGQSLQLSARLRDADGNTLSGRSVQWSSQAESVASIDSNGMLLGVSTGMTTVAATSGGIQGTVQVVVGAAPVIIVTSDSVPLSAILDVTETATAAVAITSSGGPITALTAAIEYDAGAVGWLSVELSAASAPSTLELTADASSLARGTYRATVRLTSAAAGVTPVTLRVIFAVLQRSAVPTLASVTPDRSAREQSLTVIMTGGNFVAGLTSVGFGAGITVSSITVDGPTTLTAAITVGAAAAVGQRDVTVTNPPPGGGTAVLASGFTVEGLNPRPTATGIEPASAQRQSTLDVSIRGTGFLEDITIADFGPGITVNSVEVTSGTMLLANITVGASAALGVRDVTVANPEPGGGVGTLRDAFTVLAANPAPMLSGVTPASAQRLTTLSVQLTGSQFAPGLTSITFGAGVVVDDMTVTSSTTIDADITIDAAAPLGARPVSVTNAGPGGGTATLDDAFTVLDAHPAPTIASIEPTAARSGSTLDATITGSGFIDAVTIVAFGAGVTVNDVTVSGSTSLVANITIAADAVPGPRSIAVTNAAPGGGSASLIDGFAVVGAVSADQSTLTAAPSSDVAADGIAAATVTVGVRDVAGTAVRGLAPEAFDVALTGSAAAGAITESATPGTYTFSVRNTTAEVVTVAVAVEGIDLDDQPQIGFVATIVSAANSSVSAASLTDIPADGASASHVTVVLRDPNDNVLGGLPATAFALNATGSAVLGAIAETATAGTYAFAVTNTVAEQVTVSVSAGGTALTQQPVIAFVPGGGSATNSSATVPDGTAGVATALEITVRDATDNLVSGAAASIAVSVTGANSATLAVTDNGDGTYAASYTPTVAGADNIAIAIGGAAITGSPFVSTVVAGPATQMAANTGDDQSGPVGTAVATPPSVIVSDANGNPVAGVEITFGVASGGGTLASSGVTASDDSGVATSPAWTLGTTAGTNTLTATSDGLTGSPVRFTAVATAGAATQIAITTQPSVSARSGSAFAQQPVVRLLDGSGNAVAEAGVSVSAVIAGGGGTLGGTLAVTTDAAGVAAFTDLSIAGIVGNRTLEFSAAGITPVTSDAITITAGDAAQVAIQAGGEQSATVGTTVGTAPSVRVSDASGNPVAGIDVVFAVTGGGGSLAADGATVSDADGIAVSPAWTLGIAAGANTLTATSAGLAGSPLTFTATGTSGAATQMEIITQPSQAAQSGAAFAQQPSLQIQDGSGNAVEEAGVAVIATIASGGGTLGGMVSAATNAAGVATFTNLAITGAAGDRTLQFAAGGITPVTSGTISVAAGAATQLSITTQPSASAQSGIAFTQQPVVQLRDGGGNVSATAGVTVTAAIATGGGALGGTTTVSTDANGVAAFTDLSISGPVGSRTLSFTATALTSATSTPIVVAAGTATQMAANGGNGQNAPVRTPVPFAPSVIVRDASNNPVPGLSVTFAVASGDGTLAASGTVSSNTNGIAASPAWTLGPTAGANTLTATSDGLTGSPVTFTATGTAGDIAQLTITTQPSASAQSGVALGPQPTIQLRDEFDNAVETAGVTVTAAIASGGGTLGGAATALTDATGAATFTNLMITGTTGARTLAFTAGTGITPVTSGPITITAGAASQIAISEGQGQSATVGTAVAEPPSVIVADASGNPVSGVSVTFAIGSGGGSLASLDPVFTAVNGIATSPAWTLGTNTGLNTLIATSGALTGSPVTFNATATAGDAAALTIVAQPSATAANGAVFGQQPVIQLLDREGNDVAEAGVTITAAIATGGGTLNGTVSAVTIADGTATFTDLSITGLIGDRTLVFSGAGLIPDTSTVTAITTGAAAAIAVNDGDGQSATVGTAVSVAPSVIVRDGGGNPVAGVSVTFAVASGGGSLGGGTGSVSITTGAGGIAAAPGWTLGTSAGENTLTATSAGLAGSPVTFNATGTAGDVTQLTITTQPSASAQSGVALSAQPVIQMRDVFGNAVETAGVTITAAIASGGGVLGGTATALTGATGAAAFTNLVITGTTGPRTLAFSAGTGITSATSASITITAGAASQISIRDGDGQSATVGTAVAVPPSVIVTDASGNPVAGVSVTFAIVSGAGSLGAGTEPVAVTTGTGGIAAAPAWTLGAAAGPNTLTATAAALSGSPVTFTATGTAGPAAQLVITTEPADSAASGIAFAPQPTVQLQDANGNVVAQAGVEVTAAIATGGEALGGTLTAITGEAGIAAFTDLMITGIIGPRTLELSAAEIAPDTTLAVTIIAGTASEMIPNSVETQAADAGSTVASPSVRVSDVSGNSVAGVSVTFAVTTGNSLFPEETVETDTAGIATASVWTLGTTAGLNAITASSTGLQSIIFNATGTAGPAATITFTSPPPTTAISGVAFTDSVSLQIVDQFGNPVAGAEVTPSVTAGGVLGGPPTDVTDSAGVAVFTAMSITGAAGQYTLTFAVAGASTDVVIDITDAVDPDDGNLPASSSLMAATTQ